MIPKRIKVLVLSMAVASSVGVMAQNNNSADLKQKDKAIAEVIINDYYQKTYKDLLEKQ
ncbi:hypothetical protein [Pedobacter steynii]